jgi:serine/threonine protein kinase
MPPNTSPKKIQTVLWYHPVDVEFVDEFLKFFVGNIKQRFKLMRVAWGDDNKLSLSALTKAHLIVPFLSRDFIYLLYDQPKALELTRQLFEHKSEKVLDLLPVLVRQTSIETTIFNELQLLPSGRQQPDIYGLIEKEQNRDKVFDNLGRDFVAHAEAAFPKLKKRSAQENRYDTLTIQEELTKTLAPLYTIKDDIASGETAILYKGVDNNLKRWVALKAIKPWAPIAKIESRHDIADLDLNVYGLKHRNLMTVYQACLDRDPKYIILEYVVGSALSSILEREGSQPLRNIRDTLMPIAKVLSKGHRLGFLHKNISPSNIMIDLELQPILAPFELIQPNPADNKGKLKMDNLRYWSPEQWRGQPLTPASDQFALGLVAFELISGGVPLFEGTTPKEIEISRDQIEKDPNLIRQKLKQYHCTNDLEHLVCRLLEYIPGKRYADMEDCLEELENIIVPSINYTKTARKSYERCLEGDGFVKAVYGYLFKKSPRSKTLFEQMGLLQKDGTISMKQRKKLRHAINTLLEYPNARITNPDYMKKIASGHGHEGMKIAAFQYKDFKEAIIKTAETFDRKWSPKTEKAWHLTLDVGLEYMKGLS